MNKTKQLTLFSNQQKKFFGGALLYKKRKSKRPLSKKDSIHLVLRSEWAMGSNSFLAKPNQQAIKLILLRFSKKFGVKVYQQAINSNHVHILLRITNRKLYTAFIKAVSGQIASHTMAQQSFEVFASAHKNISAHKNKSAGDGSKASSEVKSTHQNPKGFCSLGHFLG